MSKLSKYHLNAKDNTFTPCTKRGCNGTAKFDPELLAYVCGACGTEFTVKEVDVGKKGKGECSVCHETKMLVPVKEDICWKCYDIRRGKTVKKTSEKKLGRPKKKAAVAMAKSIKRDRLKEGPREACEQNCIECRFRSICRVRAEYGDVPAVICKFFKGC